MSAFQRLPKQKSALKLRTVSLAASAAIAGIQFLSAMALTLITLLAKFAIDTLFLLGTERSGTRILESAWRDFFTTNESSLWAVAALIATLGLIMAALENAAQFLATRSIESKMSTERKLRIENLTHASQTLVEQPNFQRRLHNVETESRVLETGLIQKESHRGQIISTLLMTLLCLMAIDLQLSALVAVTSIVMSAVLTHSSQREFYHARLAARHEARVVRLSTVLSESLQDAKNSNTQGLSKRTAIAMLNSSQAATQRYRGLSRRHAAFARLVRIGIRVSSLILGGSLILQWHSSIGALVASFLSIEIIDRALVAHAQVHAREHFLARFLARANSIQEELLKNREPEGTRVVPSMPLPDATTLHFNEVKTKTAFATDRGFSGEFSAGELIAIKTPDARATEVAHLLNRSEEPLSGVITIGSSDLRKFKIHVLRSIVMIVRPVPKLLKTSVREYLTEGMNSDNDQTLREALNFSRLTLDLDETIDANVQNQLVRLQLARAFLMTRTQVYLFDCVDAGVSNDEANFLLEAAGRLAERGAVVFWATMNFSSNFSSHLSSVALFDQVIDLAPKTKRKRKLTDKISKAKLLAPTMSSFQHDEESR